MATRRFYGNFSLGVVQRERLLAKDVLAGFSGADDPLNVQWVRGRDVNSFDFVISEQGVVVDVRVCSVDAELTCERCGWLR